MVYRLMGLNYSELTKVQLPRLSKYKPEVDPSAPSVTGPTDPASTEQIELASIQLQKDKPNGGYIN